jgi:signal peptidase I
MFVTKEKDNKGKPEEQPLMNFKQKVAAFFKELGIVLGLFLVINNFVIASFLVPTGSMENEVLTYEMLFVNKFIYGGSTPRNIPFTNVRLPFYQLPPLKDVQRGDVIVFVWPGNRDEILPEEFQFYLKRCVGMPGDTIRVTNRALYVNGTLSPLPRNVKYDNPMPLPAEYWEPNIFPRGSRWNGDFFGPLVVPQKGMTVDLTAENYLQWDTFIRREGHTVSQAGDLILIDGKPTKRYVVLRDYLFGMGDHRDNSLDSRYWGFIPKENLVGTPIVTYFSFTGEFPFVRFGRIGSIIK